MKPLTVNGDIPLRGLFHSCGVYVQDERSVRRFRLANTDFVDVGTVCNVSTDWRKL